MTDSIDHNCTDEVVCPYCGYEYEDSWEFGDGHDDIGDIMCDGCGKTFEAYRNVTYSYSTEKKEGK